MESLNEHTGIYERRSPNWESGARSQEARSFDVSPSRSILRIAGRFHDVSTISPLFEAIMNAGSASAAQMEGPTTAIF